MRNLPEKPDPVTGEPEPPAAPLYGNPGVSDSTRGASPHAPPGFGATLAWYSASRRNGIFAAIFTVLIVCGSITLFRGLAWVSYWQIWLIAAIGAILIYNTIRRDAYSAGVDWLRHGGWVDTYGLAKIEMHVLTNSVELELEDNRGGGLSIDIQSLQSHRRMWNLVYNGMRHSIADGTVVEINDYARSALKLPSPNPSKEAREAYRELQLKRGRSGHARSRGKMWPTVLRWTSVLLYLLALLSFAAAIISLTVPSRDSGSSSEAGSIGLGIIAVFSLAGAVWSGYSYRQSRDSRRE
ncbi:hypothetical protein [Amycolatopsis sp. CA-230715]|uniref:hypothetical protein n=1 Tax=Amycolatopsis sp. CA-230715 TaxID=2745196 RepID=UPI001C0134BA|nr:hypothetical protein [Amycolatopsis sp. CA-230715]